MLRIELIELNEYVESPQMHTSAYHGELDRRKRKTEHVTRDSHYPFDTPTSPRKVAADCALAKGQSDVSTKPGSIPIPPGVTSAPGSPMKMGSAPIVRPAPTRISLLELKPVPSLLCLGSGLNPFGTIFQSRNNLVNIERLKYQCMYNLDESRYVFDTV